MKRLIAPILFIILLISACTPAQEIPVGVEIQSTSLTVGYERK